MMKKSFAFLWIVGLSITTAWSRFEQDFRFWKASDGLGESFVNAITLSPRGNIWVSHGEITVVSRLDGYLVHRIPTPGAFIPVYESRSGQIWAIHNQGLQQYKEDRWIPYAIPEISSSGIVPILPGAENQVFFALSDRIMEFNAATGKVTVFKSVAETHLEEFVNLRNAKDGGIWVTGKRGAAKIETINGENLPQSPLHEYLSQSDDGFQHFYFIVEGIDGKIYSLADNTKQGNQRAIVRFNENRWELMFASDEENTLIGGAPGPDHSFLMAKVNPLAGASLVRLDGKRETVLTRRGILSGLYYDIKAEDNGNFWIGTANGLARYAPPLWRTPPEVESVDRTVHSILEDVQGRLWFACQTSLLRLDQDQWKEYHLPADFQSYLFQTHALCSLPDGRIAICTFRNTLLIFNPATESFEFFQHPAGRLIQMISPRRDGSVWVHSIDEKTLKYYIEIFDGKNLKTYLDKDIRWNLGSIRYLYETENGDLWFGGTAQDGIGLYSKGVYRSFGPLEGYTDGGALSIHEVAPGKLWFGGRDKIIQYDGKEWKEILSDMDSARAMITGKDGSLWVASGSGLYRYKDGAWLSNTEVEGLPNTVVYTVFEDSRGRVWAGTASGLSLYHPDADRDPPKTIVPLEQNFREITPRGRVHFIFSGVDKWQFTPADRLLYSYRLDDSRWSPFSHRRNVTFVCSPGTHQLSVRAMDRNWNIDPNPVVYDFKVLLPWYREKGFILSAAIAGLIIILLIVVSIFHYIKLYKAYGHIREANQKLRDLDRLKSAFVSQASHDLRTPLTTIKSSLDNLMRGVGGGLNEKQKQVLERAQRSVDRLTLLVNDVLDLSRIESGRVVLEKREISMKSIVEAIVNENLPAARQKEITLQFKVLRDPLLVNADRGKIERVVGELVSNAIKYTPEKGWIEIHLNREHDGMVSLFVKDTGIGMTPAECSKIFDRFYRSPAAQNLAKGTGLGLAIAKELVELHKGRISVASMLDRGSTFAVYLPAVRT